MTVAAPQIHIEGERLHVPAAALELAGFRQWVKSSEFPEAGETHNKVKSAVTADPVQIVRSERLGEAYCDGMLFTHEDSGVSTEPDFLFATWEAFESGRLRLVEKANRPDDSIELVGTPDLVVEILSDSSVKKVLVALRRASFDAGIPEYWTLDARGQSVLFQILAWTPDGYVAPSAAEEPQTSRVLGRRIHIERARNRLGRWEYELLTA